nr:hypothetical protein [Tanacetum cinerariifolium]
MTKPCSSFSANCLNAGVKGIDRVSPIKLKGTCNSDSPRSRRIMMSERDMLVSSNPQPVSQFNPITGELIMSSANVNFNGIAPVVSDKLSDLEKDKVNVGKDKVRTQNTLVKKLAAVVKKPDAFVDKTPKDKAPTKKPASVVVQDKDNVTTPAKEPDSVVVQDKSAVVAPVIEKVPVAIESDKKTESVVVVDVKATVVTAVEKNNPKFTSKVSDESVKAPVVKESVKASSVVVDKPSSVVANKVDVVKDNINVVADKVVKENVLSVVADKASNINVVAVNAPFKGNKGGLALGGIDLKKLFAQNLKQYGHIRHTQLQRDMLRQLRFKFATKILFHEINVHAEKMLELAKEFDKTDPVEKMAIIIDAFKKREERDCILQFW